MTNQKRTPEGVEEVVEQAAAEMPAAPTAEAAAAKPEAADALTEAEAAPPVAAAAARPEAALSTEALLAEIRTLTERLASERAAAIHREMEILAGRLLRERKLPESLASVLFAPGEGAVAEEVLTLRVEALTGAVQAAALTLLNERAPGGRPSAGETGTALTGEMLRTLPVTELTRIFQG